MKRIFTLLTLMAFAGMASAQFNIDALNTDYSQDFNGLSNSATSGSPATWTNGSTLTGWFAKTDATANITTYYANTGGTTTASLCSYGSTSASDRALGFHTTNGFTGSSGSGKNYLGWRLRNNTGKVIEQITITYDGEQWRKDNTVTQSLVVEFQTGVTVTDLTAGTWTSAGGGLTFTSPNITASTGAIDGNGVGNKTLGLTATITFGTPLPNGEEVMIRWADVNDSGNDHVLAIDNVVINASSPLPISLVKFQAEKLAEKVKVTWATATEINNDKFIIEKSNDGENFEFVSEVNGAGNSKELNKYEMVDAKPFKGTSYYRLTQVDFDGRSETFAPVAVRMDAKSIELEVRSKGLEAGNSMALSIYSPVATEATLLVRDLSGRTISNEKVLLTEGYQNYTLNTTNFGSGIHLIQLSNGSEVVIKKLIL